MSEAKVFYARCLWDHTTLKLFEACTGYIDPRLNAIKFDIVDVSDSIDKKLGWKRFDILFEEPNDLAVYMYRLDNLALSDSELSRDAELELRDIFHYILGMPEETEPYLLDAPYFPSCPECSTHSDNMELQDQVWVCNECGWQGDFQSKWPYVMNELRYLGRLDLFVAKQLEKVEQSSNDEEG